MALMSIVGQEYAKTRVSALFTGQPGHAFVFVGSSGIGKTMFAREVSKAFLCNSPTRDGACGTCPCCRYFDEGTHPDFKELKPASGEKNLKVSEVRSKIGADVRIFPQIASNKVYLIDGDALNEEGQNALLKTLEEPPPSVIFIITAIDPSKLLKTIVSRSVVIALAPNTEQEVLKILADRLDMETKEGLFYARYSNGIPGQALDLAQSQWFSSLREETIDLLLAIPSCGKAVLLTSCYSFFDGNKDHIDEILLIMQLVLRDMILLLDASSTNSLLNEDKRDKIVNILAQNQLTVFQIREASRAITGATRALGSNCSFESTICQMLLSVQKELTNAKSSIRPIS